MVEDWLGYLLGLVAVFDLVFLYGLVFFFLFEMVVVVFCLGVLLMMGLGLRKSCVLMKFLGFLGVGLWTVCVLFGCCVFPVYVNNSLWVWIQTWPLFCLDAVCVWICWVSFKICITGWLEFVKCGLVWFGRGFWDWFDLGGCERGFVAMVVRYWGGGCGLLVSTSRSVGCGFFFFWSELEWEGAREATERESRIANVLDAV